MASRFSNANRFEGRTVTDQLSGEIEHYTISMLVIGASGVGKSMFCNFLAQTKTLFADSCGMLSVTDRVEHCVKKIGREKVLLLDSPGFNDSIKSDEEIFEKISETAILTRDGVDVIAIVVNPAARFSTKDKNTLKMIENLGGNMWKHAFIIFNNASRIENRHNMKSEEYIKQIQGMDGCPKELIELLKEAGHRYICVESVDRQGDDYYWQCKSKEVVEMIIRLKNQNKGTRYKNKIMSMGLEGYKIVKRLGKENVEKNKEIERLHKEVESRVENATDHDNKIQELRGEIAILDLVHTLKALDSVAEDTLLALAVLGSMNELLEDLNTIRIEEAVPPPPPPPQDSSSCSVM